MPTMSPTLRLATTDDRAAVERLLTASDLPTAGIAELFASHPEDFVVADDPQAPGELAAVAGLERCCDYALLRSVAVRPEWRRHGLGHELVRHVVDEAERRGLHALYLLTTTAADFYRRFGFRPVARAAVPAAIAGSPEFSSICPSTADCLALELGAL